MYVNILPVYNGFTIKYSLPYTELKIALNVTEEYDSNVLVFLHSWKKAVSVHVVGLGRLSHRWEVGNVYRVYADQRWFNWFIWNWSWFFFLRVTKENRKSKKKKEKSKNQAFIKIKNPSLYIYKCSKNFRFLSAISDWSRILSETAVLPVVVYCQITKCFQKYYWDPVGKMFQI